MTDVLDIFTQRQVQVHADGPELVLRGNLTPEILAYAKAHKPEILAELRRRSPPVCHNRRKIALAALVKLEPDAAIRAKVMAAAEKEERAWSFLVKEHGYPAGWFILNHVDNWLRLNKAKGVAVEGPGDTITHWWLVDAPAEVVTAVTVTLAPKMAQNEATVTAQPPKQGSLLP